MILRLLSITLLILLVHLPFSCYAVGTGNDIITGYPISSMKKPTLNFIEPKVIDYGEKLSPSGVMVKDPAVIYYNFMYYPDYIQLTYTKWGLAQTLRPKECKVGEKFWTLENSYFSPRRPNLVLENKNGQLLMEILSITSDWYFLKKVSFGDGNKIIWSKDFNAVRDVLSGYNTSPSVSERVAIPISKEDLVILKDAKVVTFTGDKYLKTHSLPFFNESVTKMLQDN